jgi:hypothetical protein
MNAMMGTSGMAVGDMGTSDGQGMGAMHKAMIASVPGMAAAHSAIMRQSPQMARTRQMMCAPGPSPVPSTR